MVQSPGNADTLALTTGKPHPTIPYRGVPAKGQGLDKVQHAGHGQHGPNTIVVDAVLVDPKGHIVADGVVGEIDGLGDLPDLPPPGVELLEEITAVHQHSAGLGIEQPQDDVHEGALARSGGSDKGP